MLRAREITLTAFIMYLFPLTSVVYLLVNLFEKPIHNAVRRLSCSYTVQKIGIDLSNPVFWVNSEKNKFKMLSAEISYPAYH